MSDEPEYDPTDCIDANGEPYPEHDYRDGTECRRCGAECHDDTDEENTP